MMVYHESTLINKLKEMCTDTQVSKNVLGTMYGVPSHGVEILPMPNMPFVKFHIQQETMRAGVGDLRVQIVFDFFKASDINEMTLSMSVVEKVLRTLGSISLAEIEKKNKKTVEFWFRQHGHQEDVLKAFKQVI